MKADVKWQNEYQHQKHFEKVRAAKTTLDKGCRVNKPAPPRRPEKKMDTREAPEQSDYGSHTNNSDFTEKEKEDMSKIPLYPVLKERGLQQYTKELVSRGFGYYVDGLSLLDEDDFEGLLRGIRVMPGHSERFRQLRSDLVGDVIERQRNKARQREESDRQFRERKAEMSRTQHSKMNSTGLTTKADFSRKSKAKHVAGAKLKGNQV